MKTPIEFISKAGGYTTAQIIAAKLLRDGYLPEDIHYMFYKEDNTISDVIKNHIYNALLDIQKGLLDIKKIPLIELNK